ESHGSDVVPHAGLRPRRGQSVRRPRRRAAASRNGRHADREGRIEDLPLPLRFASRRRRGREDRRAVRALGEGRIPMRIAVVLLLALTQAWQSVVASPEFLVPEDLEEPSEQASPRASEASDAKGEKKDAKA